MFKHREYKRRGYSQEKVNDLVPLIELPQLNQTPLLSSLNRLLCIITPPSPDRQNLKVGTVDQPRVPSPNKTQYVVTKMHSKEIPATPSTIIKLIIHGLVPIITMTKLTRDPRFLCP